MTLNAKIVLVYRVYVSLMVWVHMDCLTENKQFN